MFQNSKIKNKIVGFIYANKYKLILASILLLAAYFRFNGLDSRDLWLDEIYSVQQSEKSFIEISKDVPTPIHYYFIHMFMWIGSDSFTLGFPSVIFGLASVYVIYLVGKRIAGEKTGLVAAFLLAISPMHIEFSQQILFFSYYVFFSILIAYFVIDFTDNLEKGSFKWGKLVIIALLNCLNILTQMVALVLVPVQVIFFAYLFLKNYKILAKFKKELIAFVGLIAILGIIIFFAGDGKYGDFILNKLAFDTKQPVTVGYSLSSQLGSTVLDFNSKFFVAMFSWFGIGGGFGFYIYIVLFLCGVIFSLIKRNGMSNLILMLLWIIIPFAFLYSVKLSHWFEEKYFIFIIPVYLLFIARGINGVCGLLGNIVRKWSSFIETFFRIVILVTILFVALEPIKIRTTFGFPFPGHVNYSWRKVYDYLDENVHKNDSVFLIRGGSIFLDYYYDAEKRNNDLLDEEYIAMLGAGEYADLVNKQGKNYFVSIPDFNFTFLNDVTSYEKVGIIGGFNVYKIKFKKENPTAIISENGEWSYIEDFNTSRYISHAYDWKNLITTFANNPSIPRTEGYNEISPIEFSDAYLDYKFVLPEGDKSEVYINPEFSVDNGIKFNILVGNDESDLKSIYEKRSDSFVYMNPWIKMNLSNIKSNIAFIRFRFSYDKGGIYKTGGAQLKSFEIANHINSGAHFPLDYAVTASGDGNNEIIYNAKLEIAKSREWRHHATRRNGWIQTMDGFLVKNYGTKDENPLIFKFDLPENNHSCDVNIKSFSHYTNPIDVYYSLDESEWKFLGKMNENIFKEYKFEVDTDNSEKIYLRFTSELTGPSSQIRNLTLNFK